MRRTTPKSSPPSLHSFEIAEVVASSRGPVTLDHISETTGISRATTYRLVNMLVENNVLLREPRAKYYSAGTRLSVIAIGIMSESTLRDERRAILKMLVSQIGETCNFTTLDGTEISYVDRVEAHWPMGLHLQPGSRVPIHSTASGKLFLSQMPERLRKRILYDEPLKRYTPSTVTDPVRLEAELVRIRKSKVATDDEGSWAGLIAVAVPVLGRDRRMIATVAVHAPSARMSLKRALEHVRLLRRAASDLGSIYRKLK